jgi:ribosomal protein S18 acetylase RimI-like enzyme
MRIKKCTAEYWEFVRTLRNNPKVSDGFIQSKYISKTQQKKYMEKYSDCYRICLKEDVPVGYVGVIENDIRICTHPDYQKLGIGSFMLENILKEFPHAEAKIKINNIASMKLFEKNGFKKTFTILTKIEE